MKFKIKLGTVQNAALFTAKCGEFEEDVDLIYGRYIIDAKSLMGVLSITPDHICQVEIHTANNEVAEKFRRDMSLWIMEG